MADERFVCRYITSKAAHLEQALHDGVLSDHGDPHAARRVHDFHALGGFPRLREHLLRHLVDFVLEIVNAIVHLARRCGANLIIIVQARHTRKYDIIVKHDLSTHACKAARAITLALARTSLMACDGCHLHAFVREIP